MQIRKNQRAIFATHIGVMLISLSAEKLVSVQFPSLKKRG
jgi:hypothetical protein